MNNVNNCCEITSEYTETTSDYFNSIIGYIEDIVINEEFQNLQNQFMEKYYNEFDETEENRIVYTKIFNEYTNIVETYIVKKIQEQIPFDMNRFAKELQNNKSILHGEIFELLFSLSDFLTFKETILDYKNYKNNKFNDLNAGIIITKINKYNNKNDAGDGYDLFKFNIDLNVERDDDDDAEYH